MIERRRRLFFVTSSVLALCVAGAAGAQSAPPSPPAEAAGAASGEIVVTAQKREQTLQQVPVAISAFTAVQRDKIGIDSVQDMTNFTPGLSYNTGNDRVTLRGIGRYTNQLSADSSVGVYEDGAFTTFTTKVGLDSLFVERVEVLRGPQGTLYGRNSIGGAINLISKQPTDTLQGEARATLDTYGYKELEGSLSGPVTDSIQGRVAASYIGQQDGYFHNLNGLRDEGNHRSEWYGEAQLRGEFGPHFDWWVKGFGGAWQNNGGNAGGRISNSVIVGPDGNTPVANPLFAVNNRANAFSVVTGIFTPVETTDALAPSLGGFLQPGVTNLQTVNPTGTNPGNYNIRDYYSLHPQTQDVQKYMGLTARLTGHFNGFDLRYVGSAQRYDYIEQEEWGEGEQLGTGVISYTNPQGFTISPDTELFYAEHHWFTQNEFDILSNGKGPLQWVVGAYNFNEGYKQPEQVFDPGQAQLATPLLPTVILGGAPTLAFPNPHRNITDGEANMGAETFAGFGQVDWNITKTIKITGGLRYTYDSKWGIDGAQEYTYLPVQGIPVDAAITAISPYLGTVPGAQPHATAAVYNPTNGLYERKLSADWHGVTGVAGAQWEPDRDTNVYLKYSRGYKSGGFNAGSLLAVDPETNPEHSNDYQFGIKKSFFERTVQVNLDLFYDQYYDAQVPIGVVNGSVTNTSFYNVPESRTDGVEIEATWTPIRALQLILDYGYNDTSVIKSGCVVDTNDPNAVLVGAKPGNGCGVGGQNLKGDELPNAPKNKVALNANYTIDVPTGSLTMSGSYIWRDKQYGSIFNGPQYEAPSWDQVDLRLEYKPTGGRWTVIAYGKNIFNNTGYITGAGAVSQSNGTFLKQYGLTPPAIGGVEVQFKF